MQTWSVQVPATTANLGPGFDVLGMALGLWNEIHVHRSDTLHIHVEGEGTNLIPRDETNLVYRAMVRLAEWVARPLPPVHLRLVNRIPLQGGLGSSSAAIVGGLLAAQEVLGVEVPREVLLQLAVELEGHPDNVAPALYRGLVATAVDEQGALAVPIPVPDMRVAVVLPRVRVSTEEARRLLPSRVRHVDAVFNVARAVLVVQALSRGDYSLLARVMADRLHEPYRRILIPGYKAVRRAALDAGAAAVAISGSGPALVAFAPDRHGEIAQAMVKAFDRVGVPARGWILPVVPGNEK